MSKIAWLGSTPEFDVPRSCEKPLYLMPLVEEHVLEVGYSKSPLHKIDPLAALNCVSRVSLRRHLDDTGLNPYWKPVPWFPGVMKAPASAARLGVWEMKRNEYVDRLALYAPKEATFGVLEEYIPGPQIEVNGAVLEGRVLAHSVLMQKWEGSVFAGYEPLEKGGFPGADEAAKRAVEAIGIDHAPFCIEMREQYGRWVVIDAHARFGEDRRLGEVSGSDPIQWIEGLIA